MPKKRRIRVTPAPTVAPTVAPKTTVADVLLDWRFNLIVIGCMELMLIAFSIPREITRYRLNAGQQALWREDYTKASYHYSLLNQDEPNNPGYLKCLGDTFLGRRRYKEALAYYRQAGGANYGPPETKVQAARAFYGLAQTLSDPAQQNQCADMALKLVQAARQEAPNDLKVNYWSGWFSLNYGDLIAAADYFSRVRTETIPGHLSPNEEQDRLIKRAQDNLKRIHSLIFADKDYPLDLRGLEIVSTPTLAQRALPPTARPATTSTTPAAATPAAAPQKIPVTIPPLATPPPTFVTPAVRPAPAVTPPSPAAKTPIIAATPGPAPTPATATPTPALPKPTVTPAPATTPLPAAATPAATPKPAATPRPPAAPTPAPPSPTPTAQTTPPSPAK